MKEEKKQSILKALIFNDQLERHINKIQTNSNRELELEFSICLRNIYRKLDDYEDEGLYWEDNAFASLFSILKSNKMFVLYNRVTSKLTDFSGERITYVNSPKKSIKEKIVLLSNPNFYADGSKEKKSIKNKDYKLLKEICKELEQ